MALQQVLGKSAVNHALALLLAISFGALASYFFVVFALNETVFGLWIGLPLLLCILGTGCAAGYALILELLKRKRVAASQIANFTLMFGVILLGLIIGDICSTAYFASPGTPSDIEQRQLDRTTWIGEWYPRLFYPTDKNFRLHKPNLTLTGEHYGQHYRWQLMRSPTLAHSVFQKQQVSIRINELGFRETKPLEQCSIFALGDSFTFGWGVTQVKTWTNVLQRATGNCIYNLGIHDASPKQEVLLLEYLLTQGAPGLGIRHLFWVLYEGNDLEDSYEDLRPSGAGSTFSRRFKGTVLESLYGLVLAIQHESWIYKFRTGQLRFASALQRFDTDNTYSIDGVQLANPLYYSPQHGYVLFYETDLKRASKPGSYVLNHPHRHLLEQVFSRMAVLANTFHFKVTVVIAPTVVRLYAPYFHELSRLSTPPYLIDYMVKLAHEAGFDTINLLQGMQPYTSRELLYFRDDDHWNERGNQVVAEIIAEHVLHAYRK